MSRRLEMILRELRPALSRGLIDSYVLAPLRGGSLCCCLVHPVCRKRECEAQVRQSVDGHRARGVVSSFCGCDGGWTV